MNTALRRKRYHHWRRTSGLTIVRSGNYKPSVYANNPPDAVSPGSHSRDIGFRIVAQKDE